MTQLIHPERLWQRVQQISVFTVPDMPFTRRAFTLLFTEARQWIKEQMEHAGLQVSLDAGGNLIGRKPGLRTDLAPIIIGSHCDTVIKGGRYDGIIGVQAGIEIAHSLNEQNIALQHPLEIIDFLSEEPSDYGISCVGSRAFSGQLSADMLSACDSKGETLAQAMTRIGAIPSVLNKPLRAAGSTAAYIELHIEQGPVLENQCIPVGVVTHIVGIRRIHFTVTGQTAHSGTTPMHIRRDALTGAAKIIEQTSQIAQAQSGNPHYLVATIGYITISPNASNAVPGQADIILEVRSDSRQALEDFPEQLMRQCQPWLQSANLKLAIQNLSCSSPITCSEIVMQSIESAAKTLRLSSLRMPSGAGHDAAYVAATGPIGMIFIPCLHGRSHCPEESITSQQLVDGASVMAQTLLNLDAQLCG